LIVSSADYRLPVDVLESHLLSETPLIHSSPLSIPLLLNPRKRNPE
jgi:hypothetical protein